MKRIGLDIGHMLEGDRGSIQYDGESEITFTIPVTQYIKEELDKYQCEVFLIHDGHGLTNGSLAEELRARGDKANSLNLDFLISVHHNAGPRAANGAEIYIHTKARYVNGEKTPRKNYDLSKDETELAWLNAVGWHDAPKSYNIVKIMLPIIRDTLADIGVPWRGAPDRVMCADFGMLRYPQCPCALIETHYGSNEREDNLMDDDTNRRKLAKGIAKAIATALNLAERPPVKDPNEVVVLVDGVEVMECHAKLEGTKTRVDLRPLVEAMNGHVGYDEKTKTVSVSTRHGAAGGTTTRSNGSHNRM